MLGLFVILCIRFMFLELLLFYFQQYQSSIGLSDSRRYTHGIVECVEDPYANSRKIESYVSSIGFILFTIDI
ncbi:hypothetical protein QVD17_19519 [Tagetes erecta]|uniref:Uncharacterized protein n=1 Tax=Tagetes erecta TaxID=13708 RepID=A0AAD8KJX3_TARER|nr:hypothetical protein QVD17_19519 [Tagetes erecta]